MVVRCSLPQGTASSAGWLGSPARGHLPAHRTNSCFLEMKDGADPKWAGPKMRPSPSLSMLGGARLRQRSPGPADRNCGLPGAAGPGPPGPPPSVGHSPAGRPRSSQVHRGPLLPGCVPSLPAARASSGALLHCSPLSPPASQSRCLPRLLQIPSERPTPSPPCPAHHLSSLPGHTPPSHPPSGCHSRKLGPEWLGLV